MTAPVAETTAVLFDLDGVLTDTAELHYQSWQALADEHGIPFDRQANEALRGLSRPRSLAIVLGDRAGEFTSEQQAQFLRRKNDDYLDRVAKMTPADLFPGADQLLTDLRTAGVRIAVASASRNAHAVVERLGIAPKLDAIIDGNDAARSKPDPQVFLVAAERVHVPPHRCVVVEDAESGVEAGLTARMQVVGIGPSERVGRAHVVVAGVHELTAAQLIDLATAAVAPR